jgi:hypothetical protein
MIQYFRLPNKFLLCLLSLTAAALSGASAATIYPVNDGFEEPDHGSGGGAYQYAPPAPGWNFQANAGIAANGSDFNVMGATNGNHNNGATSTSGQAAFLQGGNSFISQMLTLATGSYTLDFSLEGRLFYGANGVDIFLNGVQIGGTLFPDNLGSFNDVGVNLGNLAAGTYTIAFAGDEPTSADVTTFVDNIKIISSVPDSGGTFLLMLCSGAGLLIMGRLASGQLENRSPRRAARRW